MDRPYIKYTHGFVAQRFEPDGKGGFKCVSQEFTAGDPVEYADEFGDVVEPPDDEPYQPFEMADPTKE